MDKECRHCGADQEHKVGDRLYYHTIGVEISHVYDGVLFWACPFCGGTWDRQEGRLGRVAKVYMKEWEEKRGGADGHRVGEES